MKNCKYKLARAAAVYAGVALGLVAAASASGRAHDDENYGRDAAQAHYADNANDGPARLLTQGGPYGGGMGGTGGGTGMGGSLDSTYSDTATALPPYPGAGGTGDTSMGMDSGMGMGDSGKGMGGSGDPSTGTPDSGMGTGGSMDTGTGGSNFPGLDTTRPPLDSTRPIDSMGVPDWDEQG